MRVGAFLLWHARAEFWLTLVLLGLIATGCQTADTSKSSGDSTSSEQDQPTEAPDPDRPPPVLPKAAFLLSEYAALELTITAAADGSIQQVVISKPSRAKLYDEYTRKWVQQHWKMPVAKPGEPGSRKFIAPIVYPKNRPPPGGSYPMPDYPPQALRAREEGLVIVEVTILEDGKLEDPHLLLSSGSHILDNHTVDWIKRKWKFPPGEKRYYRWPVVYMIQ